LMNAAWEKLRLLLRARILFPCPSQKKAKYFVVEHRRHKYQSCADIWLGRREKGGNGGGGRGLELGHQRLNA